MASIVKSCAISGVDGYVVDVETKTIVGQPMISIVGLGDTAVKEARERVESAIVDAHFVFPEMKIVINLSPSDLKKSGSHFDLPIAIGLLIKCRCQSLELKHPQEVSFMRKTYGVGFHLIGVTSIRERQISYLTEEKGLTEYQVNLIE